MGLITAASIILLYRFSLQAAKPYIPLQRGRTAWSMGPNTTHTPFQHNLSSNLLPGARANESSRFNTPLQHNASSNILPSPRTFESPKEQRKYAYGAVTNVPIELRILKSESMSDPLNENNRGKGKFGMRVDSRDFNSVDLQTNLKPVISAHESFNVERPKIPNAFQSAKNALSGLGNSLVSVVSKGSKNDLYAQDLQVLLENENGESSTSTS